MMSPMKLAILEIAKELPGMMNELVMVSITTHDVESVTHIANNYFEQLAPMIKSALRVIGIGPAQTGAPDEVVKKILAEMAPGFEAPAQASAWMKATERGDKELADFIVANFPDAVDPDIISIAKLAMGPNAPADATVPPNATVH